MQAFPKDSVNNSLGGAGPVNPNINLAQFHGQGAEGYEDFSNSAPDGLGPRRPTSERSRSYNPGTRIDPVHGEETMGLGTSTFLEGAPASKTAIQRRESDAEAQLLQGGAGGAGGLQRKKSLAQKIRGMSNSRPANRTISPENALERTTSPTSPMSASGTRRNEKNSFFQDYDAAYEQKGARIAAQEELKTSGRARAPSSPRRGLGLERKVTNDSIVEGNEDAIANGSTNGIGIGRSTGTVKHGFLNRIKSVRGGRRARPVVPERKDTAP